jgi:hypothetical protein
LKLPMSARLVIAFWATTGLVVLAAALNGLRVTGWPGSTTMVIAGVFGLLMVGNFAWPLVLYIGGESDAVNLDEGFFVVLALLVSSSVTIVVFALVAIAAQAIRRRPLAKSIFNGGQMVAAAGWTRRGRPAATPRSVPRWAAPWRTPS